MNIWYLTSEFPPDFGGGISMYVNQAARMFAQQGHQVTVFVRDTEGDKVEYPVSGMRVIRFLHMQGEQYAYMGYWPALAYQYAEEVLKRIDEEGIRPDIIEVQEYNALGYYLLQRKWLKDPRLKGIPIVVHLHTPTFELARINQSTRYKFPTYWIGQMEKFCIKAASSLVTQSEFLKTQIQPYAVGKKIEVIPLPYEGNGDFNANSADYGVDKVDLLYMGRTEYRKGVVHLLKEAETLWASGISFTLKMLGGDTFFEPRNRMLGEWLKEKYAHRMQEGLLTFKSSVPPDTLHEEIKNAKAVVIPSLYENYPYNCLIAMNAGAPVIVSASGGQAEMVGEDGVNGFIFDWNVPGDFQRQVQRVLNMKETELEEVGNRGKERIRSLCNIDNNLQMRLAFFYDAIKKEKKNNSRVFPVSDSIVQPAEKPERTGEKGFLSIVIPFYNLGKHLPETLESALAITYKKFEIVIVNDGSTDEESLELLRKIEEENDPRIRIVTIENGGLANARNVGALHARGEYVAFLDADDLIEPDFYEKAIDVLESYDNISFVYSWVRYFENGNGVWPTFNTEFPYLLGMNMLTAFVVVRRAEFLKYGVNRIEMEYGMEDFDGWVAMCAAGFSGVSIPEVLVKYRVRTNSMSRQFNRNMVIYLLDKLSSGHPELYQKYGLELSNLLVANGPGYLWNNPTFSHPDIGYISTEGAAQPQDNNMIKHELMRIANSKLGSWLINTMFRLKLNKLFK